MFLNIKTLLSLILNIIAFYFAGLRARHWGFLFRNLQQAVDEIYQTCEDDESVVECKVCIA